MFDIQLKTKIFTVPSL